MTTSAPPAMPHAHYGKLSIVGIGPGHEDFIAPRALRALEEAKLIIGYNTYIRLIQHLIEGKEIIKTGMTEEIRRAQIAVDRAKEGIPVAIISSGDAGVYGMCSLVFQVLTQNGWHQGQNPQLEIIPGISAVNACASLIGAPLGHDFCAISLSDLVTPWAIIEKRIDAAAQGDFVIAFYNPASGRRQKQIVRARDIVRKYRKKETPVALVKSAYRQQQSITISNLEHFLDFEIGMLTTVIVGSSQTFVYDEFLITPRGYYENKYDAEGKILPGQKPGHSLRQPAEGATKPVEDAKPKYKRESQ